MSFKKKIQLLWVIFALLDPDSESGSTNPIESGSNPDTDPDPQPCFKRFRVEFRISGLRIRIPRGYALFLEAGSGSALEWKAGTELKSWIPDPHYYSVCGSPTLRIYKAFFLLKEQSLLMI
jgi:hypothetical protein